MKNINTRQIVLDRIKNDILFFIKSVKDWRMVGTGLSSVTWKSLDCYQIRSVAMTSTQLYLEGLMSHRIIERYANLGATALPVMSNKNRWIVKLDFEVMTNGKWDVLYFDAEVKIK